MLGRKAIVISGVLVGLFSSTLGEPLSSCDLDGKEIDVGNGPIETLPTGNSFIEYTGGPESLSPCCGDIASDDDNDNDADEICREIVVGDAFCDLAAESGIGIIIDDEGNDVPAPCPYNGITGPNECNHTMIIKYQLDDHNDETCCRKCSCFGDPNCLSFENQRDLWIVCDGRRTYYDEDGIQRCEQKKFSCESEFDHLGNRCVWLPKYLSSYDSDVHGSRCSSTWGAAAAGLLGSHYPEMLMLEADGFSVVLTLGSLGIIREVKFIDTKGEDFTLSAEQCFRYDPRTSPMADRKLAWSPSTIPADWEPIVSTRPTNPEITWKTFNARTGFAAKIVCRKVGGVARLDIDEIIEPDNDREGTGFCYEGAITNKPGHSAKSDLIHENCTANFLPDNIEVCKAIAKQSCNADNYLDTIDEYCDDFDFTRVTGVSSVSDCKTVLTSGTPEFIGQEWTRMICEVNSLNVANCKTTIGEDGWDAFLDTHSDGLIIGGNDAPASCASTIDQYTTEVEECTRATRVEYEESEDNWVLAFVIPDNLPPCRGELVVPVIWEILYTKPIRFVQCGLSADCLIKKNMCEPTQGVTVSVEYTEECQPIPLQPTPPPTPPSECDCKEVDEPIPQRICQDDSNDFYPLGDCESCCINVEEPVVPDECRSVQTQEAYCNLNEEATKCDQLEDEDIEAKLTLKFTPDEKGLNLECCPSCQCWGDPQCRSFNKTHDVWLLCESRDDTCLKSDEDVCTSFKDHAGNTCLWDADLAKKIEKHRGDIGAYGSPCQPNWAASGDAIMTMYSIEDFSASLTMGERGVIEKLILKDSPTNTYTLVADECFSFTDPLDFLDPWVVVGDAPNGVNSIEIKYVASNPTERVYHVFDSNTKIFVQVACIQRTSADGTKSGYRLNVENLVEMRSDRPAGGSGFCVTDEIDTLESEIDNELFEVCHEGSVGITVLCQNLWSSTCTQKSDIDRAVAEWCESAYAFRNMVDHNEECVQHILSDIKEEKIVERWIREYCKAVGATTHSGPALDNFISVCESDIRLDKLEEYVKNHGTGAYAEYCISDVSEYKTRGDDECNSGISIQTCRKESGKCEEVDEDWVEEFFIPDGSPPCGGEIEVLATQHLHLFTKTWRFKQCYVREGENCSIAQKCAPAMGYDISYKYEQASSVCADRRLR